MTFFTASIETIIIRFYLLMAVVVIPFIIGIPVIALFAVPIFLSCMLGVSFNFISAGSIVKQNIQGVYQGKRTLYTSA